MLRSKFVILVLLLTIGISGISNAKADDAGEFDGAIWRFHMTPAAKRFGEPMNGAFRVKGKNLYQNTKPRTKDFDKHIGQKTAAKPKKTWLTIDDMRAKPKGGNIVEGIKGKMVLTMDEPGKWSGTFIDSQGRHWDFKCERIQE